MDFPPATTTAANSRSVAALTTVEPLSSQDMAENETDNESVVLEAAPAPAAPSLITCLDSTQPKATPSSSESQVSAGNEENSARSRPKIEFHPAPAGSEPRATTISTNYNLRSPAVKRLLREAQELSSESNLDFRAVPLEDNLFEWHFTIRGPADTAFSQGVYHGRIIMPPEYPMKPPSIMMLTPNGRFETGTKICLSISNYHPETWRPSWSIRTALMALISFMATPGDGAIGSLECSDDVRRALARKSLVWVCPECGPIINDITYENRTSSETHGTASVQRLFRLPHASSASVPDDQTQPEAILTNPALLLEPAPITTPAGDAHGMHAGNHQNELAGFPQDDDDITRMIVAAIVITILALIIRRLYVNGFFNNP